MQENIFNAKLRTHNEVLKAPFRCADGSEQQIEAKLKADGERNNENFLKLMEKHYVLFNHKINKCKLSCVEKGNSYTEIKRCYSGCESGIKTFKRFVDERITQMHSLMGECVSNASQLPIPLYETYRCYDLYNKGFDHLKNIIKEESMFYQ